MNCPSVFRLRPLGRDPGRVLHRCGLEVGHSDDHECEECAVVWADAHIAKEERDVIARSS